MYMRVVTGVNVFDIHVKARAIEVPGLKIADTFDCVKTLPVVDYVGAAVGNAAVGSRFSSAWCSDETLC